MGSRVSCYAGHITWRIGGAILRPGGVFAQERINLVRVLLCMVRVSCALVNSRLLLPGRSIPHSRYPHVCMILWRCGQVKNRTMCSSNWNSKETFTINWNILQFMHITSAPSCSVPLLVPQISTTCTLLEFSKWKANLNNAKKLSAAIVLQCPLSPSLVVLR